MKIKFSDLKPGQMFRFSEQGTVFMCIGFDIFHLDHVHRVRDSHGGGHAVTVSGPYAGDYDGYFKPDNEVESVGAVFVAGPSDDIAQSDIVSLAKDILIDMSLYGMDECDCDPSVGLFECTTCRLIDFISRHDSAWVEEKGYSHRLSI